MTRTIVAILALTPAMLFAQAKSPAQPSSTPVLQSALLQPVAFVAEKSNDNAAANTTPARISTGVVAPRLVHSVDVTVDQDDARLAILDREVVVEMIVDQAGNPTNLKVIQSADQALDKNVLTAVSQFRYRPGTLDGQPAAVPVRLEVTVPHGSY
jgi:TonB family protein